MIQQKNPDNDNWKLVAYLIGIMGGAVLGALAARLYTQAVASSELDHGKRPEISTMAILGLSVSLIGIVRQIVELGTEKKKK
jgi:hypothetical protein